MADMLERAKRKRLLEKSGAKVKLGMMRHLYIILDLSDAMKHPVRASSTTEHCLFILYTVCFTDLDLGSEMIIFDSI